METEREQLVFKKAKGFVLQELKVVKSFNSPSLVRRIIPLRSQEIFNNLVELYEKIFSDQWDSFQVNYMDYPPDLSPSLYSARVYISCWLVDLYIEIKGALISVSDLALMFDQFKGEFTRMSEVYDDYLALLFDYISPILLLDPLQTAFYIPVISSVVDDKSPDPFGIENFTIDQTLMNKLMTMMSESGLWHFSTYPRPTDGTRKGSLWLADWPDKRHIGLWYEDTNFSSRDLYMAYVFGTSLTPNLGVRDIDEWQLCKDGVIPEENDFLDYKRVVQQRYQGPKEIRTYEIDADFIGEEGQVAPRLRIIDMVYHEYYKVRKMDLETRVKALKCFSKP